VASHGCSRPGKWSNFPYGIGGPIVTVAALSLALNLLLKGVFIWIVRRLLVETPESIQC
jgi:hypothetical protein